MVVCDGVRGVFARGADGRWGLVNGAELAVLEGLGGSSDGASRLRGMGAALSAGAAGPGDLVRLGRCLRSLVEADEVCWAIVPPDLAAAVTVACAWWDRWKAGQWLCWVLSARLEANLLEGLGVGAGWLGWAMWSLLRPQRAWWNGIGWMERLGGEFWAKAGLGFPPLAGHLFYAAWSSR